MGFTLDFPGSELRDAVVEAGNVRIRFAAASVRDADGVRGWLSSVTLAMPDAALVGDVALAFGKIAEGRLLQDGRDADRLALPVTLTGDLELTLSLVNGARITAHGRGLSLAPADDARFSEDLSC